VPGGKAAHQTAVLLGVASLLLTAYMALAIDTLSRVYLDRHWLSNVIGGFTLGTGVPADRHLLSQRPRLGARVGTAR